MRLGHSPLAQEGWNMQSHPARGPRSPGIGHLLQIEAFDRYIEVLGGFLDEQ